jgi:hypothetical protein
MMAHQEDDERWCDNQLAQREDERVAQQKHKWVAQQEAMQQPAGVMTGWEGDATRGQQEDIQEPAGTKRGWEGGATKARVGGATRGDATTSLHDDRMRGWRNKRTMRGYARTSCRQYNCRDQAISLRKSFHFDIFIEKPCFWWKWENLAATRGYS